VPDVLAAARPNVGLLTTGNTPRGWSVDHQGEGAMNAPQRILVVDDDPTIRQVAARALAEASYEVVEAEDGEAALGLLRLPGSSPIELVVTDLRMPRMNGVQLGQAIERLGLGVPVVYMTGYADASMWLPDDIRQTHLVLKPFTLSALVEIVGWHLPHWAAD
jgi:two-component system cell cycle sensor histidine kinase/response regulator CckA